MNALPMSLRRLLDRQPASVPHAVEPADMGTCLGLEMTLGAALPAQPQTVPAPMPSAAVHAHWWQRSLA